MLFLALQSFPPPARADVTLNPYGKSVLLPLHGSIKGGQSYIWGDAISQIVVIMKATGQFVWQVNAPTTGQYFVDVLQAVPASGNGFTVAVTAENQPTIEYTLEQTRGYLIPGREAEDGNQRFERKRLAEPVWLSAGSHWLVLETKNVPDGTFAMALRGIELTPVEAESAVMSQQEQAAVGRADLTWMRDAVYGGMFHYTSQSVDREGSNLSFADMVASFDVERFADQAQDMDLGYVLFTMGHAYPFIPAPLESWAAIHGSDHTTERDLVMELADALSERNIRFLAYFPTHVISKAIVHSGNTSRWNDAMDITKLSTNLDEILSEFGAHYGAKVSGYWLDGWYQLAERYPDFNYIELRSIMRMGNPDRATALNSWVLPTVTEWQDYYAGEVFSISDVPDTSIVDYGPAKDLPMHFLIAMEDDWVMTSNRKATVLDRQALVDYVRKCQTAGIPVTINLLLFADGSLLQNSVGNMVYLNAAIERSRVVPNIGGAAGRIGETDKRD